MNDRYLYRAKRTDNGEWVEGYVVKYGFTNREKFYIVPTYASDLYGFEVDLSTICQCTGLKDKNGNLIWENDVVKDKYMKYRVIWSEEEGSWMLQTVSGAMYGIGGVNSKKYEVIGNIFDNPELLEVGE